MAPMMRSSPRGKCLSTEGGRTGHRLGGQTQNPNPGGPAPGPGTLLTHHAASSTQVHHTLRRLVKARQVLWAIFCADFSPGGRQPNRAGVTGLTGVKPGARKTSALSRLAQPPKHLAHYGGLAGGGGLGGEGGSPQECFFSSGESLSPN